MSRPGALAIVLHTHMPYVEGFGTWPAGEEWLFEAMATSYLPLVDLLERHPGKITLSLTPSVCDQLECSGFAERFIEFCRKLRVETHRRDNEWASDEQPELLEVVEKSLHRYLWAADRFESLGRDLVAAFSGHAIWCSNATHAIMPLLATERGRLLQLRSGIASHLRRFGHWNGGFWLPECALAPDVQSSLVSADVRLACADLTDLYGVGSSEQLLPHNWGDSTTILPIDRQLIELAWSDNGYPMHDDYRSSMDRSPRDHALRANSGEPYDPDRGARRARADARNFVAAAVERVAGGGLSVVAFDTELFGHHWHEGPIWLEAVLDEACEQELPIELLCPDAVAGYPSRRFDDGQPPSESSWGRPRTFATWSRYPSNEIAWLQRRKELDLMAKPAPNERALRELMALQISDWAFLTTYDWAAEYASSRVKGHSETLERIAGGESFESQLHNIAPDLVVPNL